MLPDMDEAAERRREAYRDRLDFELRIIAQMGSGLFRRRRLYSMGEGSAFPSARAADRARPGWPGRCRSRISIRSAGDCSSSGS